MRLAGKVAIVTGAAMGNGKAIAFGLAKEGAKVTIIDIDSAGADQTAKEINKLGGNSISQVGDVADPEDVSKALKATLEKFGRIDILVNNAGIIKKVPFLEFSREDWDRILRVNLTGSFVCSQKVAEAMKKQGRGGSIINITSISGDMARPSTAAYAASKGGLKGLTKSMAVDLAKYKIRVNAIAPSYVKTPLVEKVLQDQAFYNEVVSRIPLGYIASSEDLVGPAVFLASDESSYMTGAVLMVDGGWTSM
jgi:gluconate 5-dehydrogenase